MYCQSARSTVSRVFVTPAYVEPFHPPTPLANQPLKERTPKKPRAKYPKKKDQKCAPPAVPAPKPVAEAEPEQIIAEFEEDLENDPELDALHQLAFLVGEGPLAKPKSKKRKYKETDCFLHNILPTDQEFDDPDFKPEPVQQVPSQKKAEKKSKTTKKQEAAKETTQKNAPAQEEKMDAEIIVLEPEAKKCGMGSADVVNCTLVKQTTAAKKKAIIEDDVVILEPEPEPKHIGIAEEVDEDLDMLTARICRIQKKDHRWRPY